MLASSTRVRIQEILTRLSKGNEVTLEERIYINKYASRDQNVSAWLRKASHIQRNQINSDPIDEFLNELDLCSYEPHSIHKPVQDDI